MPRQVSNGVRAREPRPPSPNIKTKAERQLAEARRKGIIIPGCHDFEPEFGPLTYSTKVKGQYELAFKETVLELGIGAAYEPLKFIIVGNDIYPPDFITSIRVGDKRVVFETHNGSSSNYLNRMGTFRQNYGDDFYLVLVSSHRNFEKLPKAERVVLRVDDQSLQVDERWMMPKIKVDDQERPEEKGLETWKGVVRSLLVDMLRNRADPGSFGTMTRRQEIAMLARAS